MLMRPELDEASKQILQVAEYIQEHGWCKLTTRNTHGNVCIIGGFNSLFREEIINGKTVRDFPGIRRLIDHLGVNFSGNYRGLQTITTWNDYRATSKEHVVATLREIAYAHNLVTPDPR